jgi:CcmD family protein
MAVAALQVSADPDKFNGFLLLGYGVMWLIVMIYVASLALRQRNLRRDIELMEQILQEDDEFGV